MDPKPPNLPPVMQNAREDLLAHVRGQFSPEDWQAIVTEAARRFQLQRDLGHADIPAWHSVVREFHLEQNWGYRADYRPPPAIAPLRPSRPNFGLHFIILMASTMTVTKIAVLWLGQKFARSDDPRDTWIFAAVLILVGVNFAYFLWRNRKWTDE